jgi:hypothetical protein
VVEASAPGKRKWSSTLQVNADDTQLAVDVPPLAAAAAAAPAATAVPNETPSASPGTEAHSGAIQRTGGLVVAGVGVVGLGLGTVFGLQATSKWHDAKTHCANYPYECDAKGLDLHSSASSKAAVSTVAFIAGGAALAVGAVLWFTAGGAKPETVAVGFGPGSAFVRGTFQ